MWVNATKPCALHSLLKGNSTSGIPNVQEHRKSTCAIKTWHVEVSLYLSLGESKDRDRKRTKAQGTQIRVVKHRCTPKLRETHTVAASLLPLHEEGTPSFRGTREKTKSTGRWSSLFQMRATSVSPIHSSKQIPLECILKNWKKFDPHTLLKKHMIFFCTEA